MSKVHVLEKNDKSYRCAIHFDVPPGNNGAGVSWQTAHLAHVRTRAEDGTWNEADSKLKEGTGTGEITAAERADVQSGAVIEIVRSLKLDGAVSVAALETLADRAITAYKANVSIQLAQYGREIS